MDKTDSAYKTIGEVAKILNLKSIIINLKYIILNLQSEIVNLLF